MVVLLVGLGLRSSPHGDDLEGAARVLVVAVPGLRWQDLEAVDTPAIDRLLDATALLSVRSVGVETDLVEGYLTFNSGNTLAPSWSGDGPVDELAVDASGCAAGIAAAAVRGVDRLSGAEVGALGNALRVAGVERRVFGRPAAIAGLMDSRGCVDRFGSLDDVELGEGVTLVEFDGLDEVGSLSDRAAILESIDRRVASLTPEPGTLVVVAALSAPGAAADVTVVGMGVSALLDETEGVLRSPTTRRDGYLRSTDLAPTLLAALSLEAPTSMNGTPAQVVSTATDRAERIAEHADLADRVAFRDRAITPVSVIVVAATVLTALAAALGATRLGTWLGSFAVGVVSLSYLSGLVAYHHVDLWVYLVLLVVLAGLLAVCVRAADGSRGPTATGWMCVLLWLILVLDVVCGGGLQINTPLGYTPTVAGRFQGIGNLAFGLLATSALVVAVGPWHWATERWATRRGWWWVLQVGAISVVVTALPRFGSDVGGTLALIPAVVAAAYVIAGRQFPGRQLGVALVASVVVVALLGLLDRSRPAAERTHLGRFVDRLLDGEAGIILERKVRANLSLFAASIWPTVLVILLGLIGVMLWRRRATAVAVLRDRRAERAFLGGWATVAVLGLLLNDSGIAVPAVMLTVAVPWLVSVLARTGAGSSA